MKTRITDPNGNLLFTDVPEQDIIDIDLGTIDNYDEAERIIQTILAYGDMGGMDTLRAIRVVCHATLHNLDESLINFSGDV